MNEDLPINIILVTSGSRGQRLLFRYPTNDECCPCATTTGKKQQPGFDTRGQVKPIKHFLQNGRLYGFPDEVLAPMLAPKLSDTNFEMNIDNLKLVGYPAFIKEDKEGKFDDLDFAIRMVHVVIALHSNINEQHVKHYLNICRMFAKALRHEEKRCRYLSNQREIMLAQIDYSADLPEAQQVDSVYELVFRASELARTLSEAFDSITSSGVVDVKLNGWITINYSLPHIVHRGNKVMVGEEQFNTYMRGIKPYHTLILLDEDRNQLISMLPLDSSPVIKRVVKYSNHVTSNFQTICQDADISLPQIFQVVAHLVYWGKCTVIYPLAESNVYVLSEHAVTAGGCKRAEEFARLFPTQSYHQVLARFSFPTTLGDYHSLLCHNNMHQRERAKIVTWLLKHRILKQLHTYVIIMPEQQAGSETLNFKSSENLNLKPSEKLIFDGFSEHEKCSLFAMASEVDRNDLSFFLGMSKYFRGDHHLEDIMYYENVPRSKLLILIDKFRKMLVTVQHEDPALV